MNLDSNKHKVDPAFNMSSMTDIVFLLLIFFMLTSSFVTETAMPVNLPKGDSKNISQLPKIIISVSKDLQYEINEEQVTFDQLESKLKEFTASKEFNDVIVIRADKEVTHGVAMDLAKLSAQFGKKISFATDNK
jgi:biopolymer transport protein ExbD